MKKMFIYVLVCIICSADIVSDEQKFGNLYRQNLSKSNKEKQEEIVENIYYDVCPDGFCANQFFMKNLSDDFLNKMKLCAKKLGETLSPKDFDTVINPKKLNLDESLDALSQMSIYTKGSTTSVRFNIDNINNIDLDYIFECEYGDKCKIKDVIYVQKNKSLLELTDECLKN